MVKIVLNQNFGFHWFQNETVSFKGYFYFKLKFYEKEEALLKITSILNEADFSSFLENVNGVFSVIKKFKKSTLVYSDLTRSFPIFYTNTKNETVLSDDIYYLKETYDLDNYDALASLELKATNHTYGNKTLLKHVFQVGASENITIKKNTIIPNQSTFSYAIEKESADSFKELQKKGELTFERTFNRLLNSIGSKTVVVPLSGGFDSRLIAVFLKKHKHQKVICYTYGSKTSNEIEISKQVAQQLNFEWYFIEYTDDLIQNYLENKEFKEYIAFAGKLSSMPNLQEYFAVKYLKENNLIPDDSVFISGYAGDLLGGSQYVKVIPEQIQSDQIADLIISKKFSNFEISNADKVKIRNEIEKNISTLDPKYLKKIPSTVFEDFDLREKIAKFIFNSASFYAFFGYEFRFPYWDKELLDFFKHVPVKYKKDKSLFDSILTQKYFNNYGVNFTKENQPNAKQVQLQKLKDKVKPFLPTFIKSKILEKNDWNNYKPITDQMLLQLKKKNLKVTRKYNDYNEIITQWFLYYSQNKL